MKKYFRIILCFTMLSAMLVHMPTGNMSAKAAPMENYDGVLVQMGIVDSEIAQSDEVLTRAEFGVMVSDILTWNGIATASPATRQIFKDVSQWDWLAAHLEFLYDREIINGYGDSTFRPDEPMVLSSAYSMLLNVLGYKPLIALSGKFPESVMETAKVCELNEGLQSYPYDAKLTGKMAAVLLDNLLNTEVMEVVGSDGTNLNYETDNIFLNDYMSIYEYEGIITGTEGISILGNIVDIGKIEIDGVSYQNAVNGAEALMGYEVTYYLGMQDGIADKVHAVIPEKNNNVLELDNNEALELDSRKLEYEENNRVRTVDISAVADIIVNGVPKTESEAAIPQYGTLKLVDNNDDNKYDVVIISDYDTVIIETVDITRNIIYGQNIDGNGSKYVIELDNYDYAAIFNENGEKTGLETLQAGKVLTGEISDAVVRLHYSDKSVTGEVKALNYDSDGTMQLTIGETLYIANDDVYLKNGVISAGANGEFLLDFKGNIAAAIINKNGAWSFGYLFNGYTTPDGSGVAVKLLAETGTIERIECTNDIRVNGTKHTVAETVSIINSNAPYIVRYRMKDDKINAVDTPVDQPMADFTTGNSTEDALLRRSYAPMQYKSSVNTFKQRGQGQKETVASISKIPYDNIVNGEALITANTVIFTVPIDLAKARDTDYGVIKKSALTADQQCDVAGYNTSGETLASEAVVIYEEDSQIKVAAKLFIVDKEVTTINADGEPTYMLKGFYNGVESERNLESADLITVNGHRLSKGDIIRTRQDAKGITTSVELVYSADGTVGHLANINQWKPENVDAIGFDSPMRCLRGTVVKKSDSNIVFTYGTKTELFDISKTTIYVMDADSTTRETTYIGTVGDVEEGRELVVSTRSSSMTELIVLK